MASNLIAMASNLRAMASTLLAMANPRAMAFNFSTKLKTLSHQVAALLLVQIDPALDLSSRTENLKSHGSDWASGVAKR